MKLLKIISQLIIGTLFVFSGFVKAVDPIGGAIKLTDYFMAMHLDFLSSLVLPFSVLLAAVEFLVGIHLILRLRSELTSWLLLIFSVCFTGLTLYIAIENPVSDCGCFGDAWKLSNWATFYKNIIMLPFVFFIFWYRRKYHVLISPLRSVSLSVLFILFIVGVSGYSLKHLPIVDFRPYFIGSNIIEGMTIPEGAEQPEYETVFVMEKDGVRKVFGINDYPYNDSTWVFIESKSTMIKEGYIPPMNDFSLETLAGENITQDLLQSNEPLFFVIIPKFDKADLSNFKSVINLYFQQQKLGRKIYIVTSSLPDEVFRFDTKYGIGFDYLVADEIVLKTMIRSNPGVMLIQSGTVVGKWNLNDFNAEFIAKEPLSASIAQMTGIKNNLKYLFLGFLLISVILIFYKKLK
ncbi:MAG: DoxX family protein [Marinilabiliaceae bacterium]|nr:DoxX family protein [Marinilabiliaceae bacterium]